MSRSLFFSFFLHAFFIYLTALTLPFMLRDPIDLPPIVSVEFIEIKDTTVNEWGCVPEYKNALENQLGKGALEKFDQDAKANMKMMNNFSTILYSRFKEKILKV